MGCILGESASPRIERPPGARDPQFHSSLKPANCFLNFQDIGAKLRASEREWRLGRPLSVRLSFGDYYRVIVRMIPNVCVNVPDVAVTVSWEVLALAELLTLSAQPLSMLPVRNISATSASAA